MTIHLMIVGFKKKTILLILTLKKKKKKDVLYQYPHNYYYEIQKLTLEKYLKNIKRYM